VVRYYGDWNPRKDTFPGDSIKQMVDEFHKQGIWRNCGGCRWEWKMGRGNMSRISMRCRKWCRSIRIG
jgi:hypothetical protein